MNYKLVISDPKNKKAYQKEIDQKQTGLKDKKIGEKISGNNLGLPGYELEITGGSDRQGFPMRKDVEGILRKRILLALPPGFHPKLSGQRKRKSVRGNTVSEQISQVNLKVVTFGKESLDKLLGSKPKPKEEAKEVEKKIEAEKPKETKPEAKTEEKEEPKKEEKPAEAKPEVKTEEKSEKAEEKMGVKDIDKAEKETKEKESKEKK